MAYGQAKKDYEYLETINEVDDTIMFAADETFELMANPTKKNAEGMYIGGIEQWFWENRSSYIDPKNRRRVKAIKDRYLI